MQTKHRFHQIFMSCRDMEKFKSIVNGTKRKNSLNAKSVVALIPKIG